VDHSFPFSADIISDSVPLLKMDGVKGTSLPLLPVLMTIIKN